MAAPIVVNVPMLVSDDLPCELDALARPVVCTPFLDWFPQPAVAGAAPTVTLGTRHMVRAFAQRCGIGPMPVDVLAARNSSMLQLGFNGAGWSRILTELEASGLFQVPFQELRAFDAAFGALSIRNPNQLVLVAADWLGFVPAFAPPVPVVPAAPASPVASPRAAMAAALSVT